VDGQGCEPPSPTPAPVEGTLAPTDAPAPLDVASVLGTDSTVFLVGGGAANTDAADGTTDVARLYRDFNFPCGFTATPSHGNLSQIRAIRIYWSTFGTNTRNPTSYKVEGRIDRADPWEVLAEGNFYTQNPGTNPGGSVVINSTATSGDSDLLFEERAFNGIDITPKIQYRVTFPTLQQLTSDWCEYSEIELPGTIFPYSVPPPPGPPTPTTAPTDPPEPIRMANVLDSGSYLSAIGGGFSQGKKYIVDGTTDKMSIYKSGEVYPGFQAVPAHNKLSSVHGIRVYWADFNAGRDPTSFVLQGRLEYPSNDPWVDLEQGDIPWVQFPPRNAQGQMIQSNYTSGDTNLHYSEVLFTNATIPKAHYRIVFPTNFQGFNLANGAGGYLEIAEVELPGEIYP